MTTAIDQQHLHTLLGRVVVDVGSVSTAPLVLIGDRLALYRVLAESGPLTSGALAQRTSTHERYVREWLNAQAASGYVTYDAGTGQYRLTPEQVLAFAHEGGPAFMVGAFQVALAAGRSLNALTDATIPRRAGRSGTNPRRGHGCRIHPLP